MVTRQFCNRFPCLTGFCLWLVLASGRGLIFRSSNSFRLSYLRVLIESRRPNAGWANWPRVHNQSSLIAPHSGFQSDINVTKGQHNNKREKNIKIKCNKTWMRHWQKLLPTKKQTNKEQSVGRLKMHFSRGHWIPWRNRASQQIVLQALWKRWWHQQEQRKSEPAVFGRSPRNINYARAPTSDFVYPRCLTTVVKGAETSRKWRRW